VIASIPHRKYSNKLNDISLMKLDEPLPISHSIRAIDIATEEIPAGSKIIIAGWGKSSTFGTITNRLKVNTLRALSSRGCAYSLGINYRGLICLGHSRHNGACYVRFSFTL
jgi:Trypsin